jgi:prefoldin beta subunit
LSQEELPPWLRENLARFDQLQQNLQAVLMQKQQVDAEGQDADRALEELKKASETDPIYKYAGSLLVKVGREAILKELEEKKELSSTRTMVLSKQEARLRESIKELQTKINEAVKTKPTPPRSAKDDESIA